MIQRLVTITLSPAQAEALLHVAEIGAARLHATGSGVGGHKARNGAIRILERTIANMKLVAKEKGERWTR